MAECWPYVPMTEIAERLAWLTEVDQRRDDESRWGFRTARQVFNLKFRMTSELYIGAEQLLEDNVSGDWLLPIWTDGTATAITFGATTIPVATTAEFFAGGKAIIWETFENFEIVDVVSVASGSIVISPAAAAARSRSYVMPLRGALIRDGASVQRLAREAWEIEINFETTDNPDLSLLMDKAEIEIAISLASSMASSSSTPGFSRLAVAKVNAISLLNHLERTGVAHDVQISLFSNAQTSLKRDACDAAGYQDLRDFVSSAVVAGSSVADYAQALSDSSTFFNDAGRRVTFLVSDSAGTGASGAITIRTGVARLEVFGIMLDDASTTQLARVDNTGGARSVDDGNDDLYSSILLGLLDLDQADGIAVFPCGAAVLGGQGGTIIRATSYLDSGLGPVIPVVERSVVENTRSATIRHDTRAETFEVKRLLHFLQGRNRPFYIADQRVQALDMTETTARVAARLLAPGDWVGRFVDLFGTVRTITGATLDDDEVEVTFERVEDLPYPLALRMLRRVRLYSDDLEIQHNMRAGWATLKIEAGKI